MESSPLPAFPGEVNTEERLFQHDRMMRDNYWHAGGGASYEFQHFDVFGSYTGYIAGTDTHAGRAFTRYQLSVRTSARNQLALKKTRCITDSKIPTNAQSQGVPAALFRFADKNA
jgi:hypothetical protein